MGHNPKKFTRRILASAVAASVTLSGAAIAQDNEQAMEEVLITGIRAAMVASMDTKRNSVGVVDAINAEDIGKFPDTNLAESLQRITGVAIDRSNGEGSRITVRGFGPDNNMVTLNGRNLPGGSTYAGGGGGARAFDFANLASDAIAGIEVYKTGKANLSTGGIGATVNIKTSRPLENPGLKLSFGLKGVMDTTNRTGDDLTPELSGLFSWSDDAEKFGVSLTASYQERDSGYTGATVNDWNIGTWSSSGTGDLYQQGDDYANSAVFENTPDEGQLYARPNDIRYVFSDSSRTRTNSQLTFQFAPSEQLMLTADYTYAQNELEEQRGEITNWIQNGAPIRRVVFDDSAIATPLLVQEDYSGSDGRGFADIGLEQQYRRQENTLESLGLNLRFDASEQLTFFVDVHDSDMNSLPKGPAGTGEISVGLGSPTKQGKTLFFGGDLPYWTYDLNDCAHQAVRLETDENDPFVTNCNNVFDEGDVGSTVMRMSSAEQRTDITQLQIDGHWEFEDGGFDFGIDYREISSTTASYNNNQNQELGGWGADNPGEFPDGLIEQFNIAGEFDDYSTGEAPGDGFRADARALANYLVSAPQYESVSPYIGLENTETGTVRNSRTLDTVSEDTFAAYFQFSTEGELAGFPTRMLAGFRYETTDVESLSDTPPVLYLSWQSDNDFSTVADTNVESTVVKNSYDNMLPSFDFDINFMDNLTGRFSFGKTIARAPLGNLSASVTGVNANGATLAGAQPSANVNNPELIPLESTNFDLSLEWYFADTSYVSGGLWEKRVNNFVGSEQTQVTLFDVRDQTNGPRALAAAAALQERGFLVDDANLHTMMVILDDAEQFPDGADAFTGEPDQISALGQQCSACDILPNADDPLTEFDVTQPINNKEAKIYGLELAVQHFFGETGFGVMANYTLVQGDVGFNDLADPSESQFALLGLSDTANLVLMYEKYGIQARLAYNWRDEFLNRTNVGGSNNPGYVEAYSQIDMNVSYDLTDNMVVFLETINLTGENRREHARNSKMLWGLEDLGARYQFGARYTF